MSDVNKITFEGPLFIIGMPRSGTKLLRDLLNRHTRISVPEIETNILPIWAHNWKKYGDLSDYNKFLVFYRSMLSMPYFIYMKQNHQLIDVHVWYEFCKNFTISGVFEALVRHDANIMYDSDVIWGDKSPLYISYTSLIKSLFPEALFIHIVRDVRDYCLSINKAWNKNMYRAAQRWSNNLAVLNMQINSNPSWFLEIKYEDLITNPKFVLSNACKFLHISYEAQMMNLSKPSENLGDAKGLKTIKSDNMAKYKFLLDYHTLKKIESISGHILKLYDYDVSQNGNKKICKLVMLYYKFLDNINMMVYTNKSKNFFIYLKHNIRLLKIK